MHAGGAEDKVDGVKTEVGTVLNKLFRGAGGGVSGDVGDRVRRRG